MLKANFYLDKPDKNHHHPIYVSVRKSSIQIKVALGEKIKLKDWNKKLQRPKSSYNNYKFLCKYLDFIQTEFNIFIQKQGNNTFTEAKIKAKLKALADAHKVQNAAIILQESTTILGKTPVTFIDLFAGAGGFSEGFLQAETNNKFFDFLLASDINENCELTHRVRYNYQLGLDAEFITQDITEHDFLDNLFNKIQNKTVDVVCGGPPCQSFSLAGKRKKFDKKDDLFSHYLKVIRLLRPKYFVMENVKGILTKEGGKIKDLILKEIRSIIDVTRFPELLAFISTLKATLKEKSFLLDCYLLRLQFEVNTDTSLQALKDKYIQAIESRFRSLTPKIVDYKTSKTDVHINTIRRGFKLLQRDKELNYIRKKVIYEKAHNNLDDDLFAGGFDEFLNSIDLENIVENVQSAFKKIKPNPSFAEEIEQIVASLTIYLSSFDECMQNLLRIAKQVGKEAELNRLLDSIRLYNINKPFIALASDYGVPQNRERVLFIGCRKDQPLIEAIPPTVKKKEKVTVFEALFDLDFIDNNEDASSYEEVDVRSKFNGSSEAMLALLKRRNIDGSVADTGETYANWSKKGRLNGRFADMKPPVYVRNFDEYRNIAFATVKPLQNHKTSNQNADVIKRLEIILSSGEYEVAKQKLRQAGLDSEKRNYNVLKPDAQSPTVMTIPDDYIHYSSPRALTVREMARLQSFDDSFVFQGKRSTGGDKRKVEVPQFTLVGNAVPPLMARAVAMEILKKIQ